MRLAWLPAHASGRGEVDDPPPTLVHMLVGCAIGQKGAASIHREHFFPLIQGDFICSGVRRNSGSIDLYVQPAQLCGSPSKGPFYRFRIRDIADMRTSPAIALDCLLRGAFA